MTVSEDNGLKQLRLWLTQHETRVNTNDMRTPNREREFTRNYQRSD